MSEKKKLLEVDLYKPIQKHFMKQGYRVNGEVNDCDLTAIKGDELVIVELKLSLTIDLLVQATKRQRLTDHVYIAIPRPKNLRSRRWHDVCHLVRKLDLGLITVAFTGKYPRVEFAFHPESFDRRKSQSMNKRKRKALLSEIEGRSADYNVGGSNKTKIMTAYKENCVQIACYLDKCGPMSPKSLVEMGTGAKTSSILTKNFYNWFDRVKRGVYQISDKGRLEIKENPELVEHYLEKIVDKEN